MKFPNDEGSQFPKFYFPCNKEERVVLNYFFLENTISATNDYKPAKGSLSSSQLFVTASRSFALFSFVLFISLKQLVNGVQFFSIVCLSFLSGSLTASIAPTPTSYGFFNKYTYMTLII